MTGVRRNLLRGAVLLLAMGATQSPANAASGYTLKVLSDQLGLPMGPIVLDGSGNLYGIDAYEPGDIYRLSPTGQYKYNRTLLSIFVEKSPVGVFPQSGLIADASGRLFGATPFNDGGQGTGCGSVFSIPETGAQAGPTALYHPPFLLPKPSCEFQSGPTLGPKGALYGTALSGGGGTFGSIYRLLPPLPGQMHWRPEVIYAFTGLNDGAYPEQPLLVDASGAAYGTALATANGPHSDLVPIYKLSPPAAGQNHWQFELIWRFVNADCSGAVGKFVEDADGAVYGVCVGNVTATAVMPGTVFKLTPPQTGQTKWTKTILWRFDGKPDGHPNQGVVMDAQGNLYGTTSQGDGTVFELSPPAAGGTTWTKHTLWVFNGAPGILPSSPLVLGPDGGLFGTLSRGGPGGAGIAYELVP